MTALAALLITAVARAEPVGGDLCFPYEGWALVARWRLGGAARSVREGWWRREFRDLDWRPARRGADLPRSAAGVWLRGEVRLAAVRPGHEMLRVQEAPPGGRLFLNGADLGTLPADGDVPVLGRLRAGRNVIAVRLDAPRADVPFRPPRLALGGGAPVAWRVRADEAVAGGAPSTGPRAFPPGRLHVPRPLVPADGWLPASPVWYQAVLAFSPVWGNRPLTVYLHALPGRPAVFVNGVRVAEAAVCPLRIPLGPLVKRDGRDTLVLAYDVPPGEDEAWGVAAVHWADRVARPPFPSPAVLRFEAVGAAAQPGMERALRFAAELLAAGGEPYVMTWTAPGAGDPGAAEASAPAATLVACWPQAPVTSGALADARRLLEERCAPPPGAGASHIWLVTPPAAGRSVRIAPNSRLGDHSRDVAALASARGARVVPVFDVFSSALRRQRRWAARPLFADDAGVLTPHGSFLAAIALLEAFSLP